MSKMPKALNRPFTVSENNSRKEREATSHKTKTNVPSSRPKRPASIDSMLLSMFIICTIVSAYAIAVVISTNKYFCCCKQFFQEHKLRDGQKS